MYKLVAERRAWWPVTFNGVTEDGDVVANEIEMRFTIHGEDEFVALFDEALNIEKRKGAVKDAVLAAATEGPEPVETAIGPKPLSSLYADFVEKIASDWRGVAAENGEPMKWDRDNLQLLMNVPGVFQGTLNALVACRRGIGKVREGN